ncbi:hypothetical protein KCU71_g4176, partial [Aureobasidium melanogenum]
MTFQHSTSISSTAPQLNDYNMAEPSTYMASALSPPPTSATKRSSDGDPAANKRQKTTQQNNEKTIYDINTVLLEHKGSFVTEVPLLNFLNFASEKLKDLVEISDRGPQGWRFYTYDASVLPFERDVERWASWLTNRDLRAIMYSGQEIGNEIDSSLVDAELIEDVDYQDALVDIWMMWLQHGQHPGSLSVDRIRHRYISTTLFESHSCLGDLGKALILHHDGEAGMSKDTGGTQHYETSTRKDVRRLAKEYFSKPGREPKDPLKLSADGFCQKYHSHHKKNWSCYRIKGLPGKAPSGCAILTPPTAALGISRYHPH